jgi:hypothetical protein
MSYSGDDFLNGKIDVDCDRVPREVQTATAVSANKENQFDSTAADVDVERAIHGFNEELDSLIRSFDVLSQHQQQQQQEEQRQHQTPSYAHQLNNNNNTNTKTPYSSWSRGDPPPSADRPSPLRFSSNSTPQRGRRRSTDDYNSYSSTARTTSRFDRSSQFSPKPVNTPGTTTGTRGAVSPPPPPITTKHTTPKYREDPSSHIGGTNHRSGGDWELVIDQMKETLQHQDRTIRNLQRENEDLKRQLRSQQESKTLYETYPQQTQPPSNDYRYQFGDHRHRPSSTSTAGTTSLGGEPSRRYHRDNEGAATATGDRRVDVIAEGWDDGCYDGETNGFTPGTKFVAELARLMKLEEGHHAPLSVILDKHWDRLRHHLREDATAEDY